MKATIQTLGCKVNQAESASIEGILRNNNYQIVKCTDNPDVWVINTCTVTAKSDHQSRQLIRRAARSGAKVIATGCYARLHADRIASLGNHIVAHHADYSDIIGHLEKLSTLSDPIITTTTNKPVPPLVQQPYYSDRSRALLKIQDGCNHACSYCTVPLARGKSRSLSRRDVLVSAESLVRAGYREIVLTGVHIGAYGADLEEKSSLSDITNEIAAIYPDIRIRLSSIEPKEFCDDFISLIKSGNVCSHLHIPLQSGSDRILEKMKRSYRTAYYKQLINNILTTCPDISIGTDIVVGFPGETDKDFDDTVKYLDDLALSYFHVFRFSKRPNTAASTFPDQVPDPVKKERAKKLLDLSKIKKKDYMKRHSDKVLDVIVEKRDRSGRYYSAISDNYLRVIVKSDDLRPKRRLRVRVRSISGPHLIAEPLDRI